MIIIPQLTMINRYMQHSENSNPTCCTYYLSVLLKSLLGCQQHAATYKITVMVE